MVLVLQREYYQHGTNGVILLDGVEICHTIELPWLNNRTSVSCIPEGEYKLVKRESPKFKKHLALEAVKDRKFILIHPANNALKELNGCIAPVSYHNGIGKGIYSRLAFNKLLDLVYAAFATQTTVTLRIEKKQKI